MVLAAWGVALLAGGAVGWIGHYLWTRRAPLASVPSGTHPPQPAPAVVSKPADPIPAPDVLVAANPVASIPPTAAAPATVSRPAASEGVGLARRVITHLSRLGRIGPDDVAPVGFTQQGMAAALEVRQGTLVKVLQRLRAADVLTVDRRHVSGVDRRLNVYRLTSLGESIAQDLRHRPRGPQPAAPPNEWVDVSSRPRPSEWTRDSAPSGSDSSRNRSRV
jgi:DNA-binding PadR family transcriptional regulator